MVCSHCSTNSLSLFLRSTISLDIARTLQYASKLRSLRPQSRAFRVGPSRSLHKSDRKNDSASPPSAPHFNNEAYIPFELSSLKKEIHGNTNGPFPASFVQRTSRLDEGASEAEEILSQESQTLFKYEPSIFIEESFDEPRSTNSAVQDPPSLDALPPKLFTGLGPRRPKDTSESKNKSDNQYPHESKELLLPRKIERKHFLKPEARKIESASNQTVRKARTNENSDQKTPSTPSSQQLAGRKASIGAAKHKGKEEWQIQKEALKKKFGQQRWEPRKKLSPDALDGIRSLHQQHPDIFTTPVLAERFQISPEAIRRILKSKWRPTAEEEEERRSRWDRRGERIWTSLVQKGIHPPKKWRDMGVGRDVKKGKSWRNIDQRGAGENKIMVPRLPSIAERIM